MTFTSPRKVYYWIAAALLALLLAGPALTAPVLADCSSTSSTVCGG